MRVSFISVLALILAMMPLHASDGNQAVGSATSSGRRSSLDTPSTFAVRKKSGNPAMFGVPRGGAAPAAKAQVATPTFKVDDVLSKEKIGWFIGLLLNLVYLFFFFQRRSTGASCDYTAGGFCVTNYDFKDESCPLSNSHTWAFLADCYYTYKGIKAPTNRSELMRWVMIIAIFGHGALHAALGVMGCGGSEFQGAVTLFTIFTAGISYAIVASVAKFEVWVNIIITAIASYLTVFLAGPNGSNGISSIFLITQLLATLIVSITPNNGAMNDMAKIGNAFVLPCGVSLMELLLCCGDGSTSQGIFNKLGGHVWYDIALHRCLVMAIPNGAEEA